MLDVGLWRQFQAQAGQLEPQADVHVLAVHEVARVEAAQLPEDVGGEQHEGAVDPVARRRSVSMAGDKVAPEQGQWGRDFAYPVDWGPTLFRLHGIGATDTSLPHGGNQLRKRVAREAYVGVEHAEVRCTATLEGLVVVSTVTQRVVVVDEGERKRPVVLRNPIDQGRLGHVEREDDFCNLLAAKSCYVGEQMGNVFPMPVADDRHRHDRIGQDISANLHRQSVVGIERE